MNSDMHDSANVAVPFNFCGCWIVGWNIVLPHYDRNFLRFEIMDKDLEWEIHEHLASTIWQFLDVWDEVNLKTMSSSDDIMRRNNRATTIVLYHSH